MLMLLVFLKSHKHCLLKPSPSTVMLTLISRMSPSPSYINTCKSPESRARCWPGTGVSALPGRDQHSGNSDVITAALVTQVFRPHPHRAQAVPSSLPVEAQKYGEEQDQSQPGLGALALDLCEEEAWVTRCLSRPKSGTGRGRPLPPFCSQGRWAGTSPGAVIPLSLALQPLGTCLGAPAHWQAPGGQDHAHTPEKQVQWHELPSRVCDETQDCERQARPACQGIPGLLNTRTPSAVGARTRVTRNRKVRPGRPCKEAALQGTARL